jgi:hypothetical protein
MLVEQVERFIQERESSPEDGLWRKIVHAIAAESGLQGRYMSHEVGGRCDVESDRALQKLVKAGRLA